MRLVSSTFSSWRNSGLALALAIGLVGCGQETEVATPPPAADGAATPAADGASADAASDGDGGAADDGTAVADAPAAEPELAPEVADDPMKVVVRTLDNGLTVMLSENHEAPRITAWITTRAGSAKDPAEATGMAHYLEHMLFKGTEQLGTMDWEKEKPHLDRITELYDELFVTTDPAKRAELSAEIDKEGVAATQYQVPNEYDQLLDSMGFQGLNAFTNTDQTSYIVNLPANRLEHWATIEAERFTSPVFRLFQTELEAVYEEMNQSLDSKERLIYFSLLGAMFPGHPYGDQTTLGKVEHLKNPSITKMYEYFKKWYVPGNMVVALAGDFDSAEAMDVLERTLGQWEAEPVTPDPEWTWTKPTGRNQVNVVHRGDEQVMVAFPTVHATHEDADALTLCDMMLDNQQTGLINVNISQTQAMRSAGSSPSMNLYGGFQLLQGVPKPGQTLEDCEKLLLEQIEKLKAGEFTEEDLAAVLTDFELTQKRSLESNDARVRSMTQSYLWQTPWSHSVEWLDRLAKLNKADVVAAANKYFGDNFVVIQRTNGEPDLPDVTKPTFTPVKIEGDKHTPFYDSVLAIPAEPIEPKFAVKGEDYQVQEYDWGTLYYVENPVNDIFDVAFSFEWGTDHDKRLQLAGGLVNFAGAGDLDLAAYKRKLYSIGSSIGGGSGDKSSGFSASGLDEHFAETLALMKSHFTQPTGVGQADLDKLVTRIVGARGFQKQDPRALNGALVSYAMRGDQSPFLTGPTNEELKALKFEDLLEAMGKIWTFKRTVTYTGSMPIDEVAKLVAPAEGTKLEDTPAYEPATFVKSDTNRVLFLNTRAAQSQVMILGVDGVFDRQQFPYSRVYNEIMGGGMGSLVFQEVREARSLAYSVFASYRGAQRIGDENLMMGQMSNQADKTIEAIDVLMGLIRNMPESQERLERALKSIDESYRTNRLGFRQQAGAAVTWHHWGLDEDPREWNWKTATSMTQEKLSEFASRFADMPFTVTVVGNKEKVDLSKLAEFGEVVEVEVDRLFNF